MKHNSGDYSSSDKHETKESLETLWNLLWAPVYLQNVKAWEISVASVAGYYYSTLNPALLLLDIICHVTKTVNIIF
jgi:hypothetical protein